MKNNNQKKYKMNGKDKATKQMNFRISESEAEILRENAKMAKMSSSEYIRKKCCVKDGEAGVEW